MTTSIRSMSDFRFALMCKIYSPFFWKQSLRAQLAEAKELAQLMNGKEVPNPVAVSRVMHELGNHAGAISKKIAADEKPPQLTGTELKMIRAVSKRLGMILETYDA